MDRCDEENVLAPSCNNQYDDELFDPETLKILQARVDGFGEYCKQLADHKDKDFLFNLCTEKGEELNEFDPNEWEGSSFMLQSNDQPPVTIEEEFCGHQGQMIEGINMERIDPHPFDGTNRGFLFMFGPPRPIDHQEK